MSAFGGGLKIVSFRHKENAMSAQITEHHTYIDGHMMCNIPGGGIRVEFIAMTA